ncbi:MAG: hypothetical protein IPN80_07380 [Flavobacterium sp.]|nr:hypothetical protein [Flavobacterium sp.]
MDGQTMSITTSIPRLLPVANLSKPLDIFKTTGGATKLFFPMNWRKKTQTGLGIILSFHQQM